MSHSLRDGFQYEFQQDARSVEEMEGDLRAIERKMDHEKHELSVASVDMAIHTGHVAAKEVARINRRERIKLALVNAAEAKKREDAHKKAMEKARKAAHAAMDKAFGVA